MAGRSPRRHAVPVLGLCGGLVLLSHPGLTAPRPSRGAVPPVRRGPGAAPVLPAPQRPQKPSVVTPVPDLPAVPPPGNELMHVEDVRPGMKGYGLTVFRGTKIERFNVEVIDVMPKANLGKSLVLVRLSGGPITERGAYLIQGMSGSPVYINGKLLGAFSMGNAWPKEPQGMITPIEDMLEAWDPKLSEVPAGQTAFDFNVPQNLPAATGLFAPPVAAAAPNRQRFAPLAIPVTVSGISGARLDRVADILRPFNMNVLGGPGSMGKPVHASLIPGAAIGVALMSGDIDMTGIGTVTYRDGDRILAFGHPMMQLGAAQFPITTAYIQDVFPGFEVSHKIGSAGEICGTLTQDRPFSIAGKVGPVPPMIPVTCSVEDKSTGRKQVYHVKTANHPLLVGQLLPVAVNQAMFNVRPVPGDTLATVKMTVETEGAGTVTRSNVIYDPAQIDVAAVRELQELMGILSTNQFRRVPVKNLDFQVSFEDSRPTATVERIFLSEDKVKPGGEVEVGVVLRPYRKEPVVRRVTVKVPESAANGRAILLVQGGATRVSLTGLAGGGGPGGLPGAPPPDASLRQMLKKFEDRERNDQLAVRIVYPTTAVNVNGERLSQLPSYLVDVMRSSKATGFRMERDESRALQNTPYIVQGVQVLPLNIEKEDHLEKPRPTGIGAGTSVTPSPFGGGMGSSLTTLSAGEDGDDLSTRGGRGALRLSIDGKPYVVRLTPEDDEVLPAKPAKKTEEKPRGKKSDKKADAKKPDLKPAETPKKAEDDDDEPVKPISGSSDADAKLVGRQAKSWLQTTQADFERGTLTNTAVSSVGEVRLAPSLRLAHESNEQFVWSVAAAGGSLYAGTGNTGQVLKIGTDGKASVFFNTGELEVHAIAQDKAGNLYVGTSPNGKVFRVTPDGKGTELFSMNGTDAASEKGGKFVLSLAVAGDGTVYAGTGPDGWIYRIKPGGKGEQLCRAGTQSVTSLIVAPDGTLVAGTAEEGSVYRITVSADGGNARILYDTDQAAVTGLAVDKEGTVYAACAPSGDIYRIEADGTPRVHYKSGKGALYDLKIDATGSLYTCSANNILRVEPTGTATILTDQKNGQFTCLAWDPAGNLVAGSANTGSVYQLNPAISGVFESTIHDAKVPARWGRMRYTGVLPTGGVLSVETRSGNTPEPDVTWSAWEKPTERNGSLFVSSPAARFLQYRVLMQAEQGSPALRDMTINYLTRNQAPRLTLSAPAGGEIFKGVQALKWSAADPDGDTLTYELAYSADGGRTWNPVGETSKDAPSAPAATPAPAAAVPSRAGALEALKRFREQLDADPSLTPAQRDESYNKAKGLIDKFIKEREDGSPEAKPAEGAAAAKPAEGKRPNGVTRSATLNWDTKQVPDGIYVLRIIATDRASNPTEAMADVKITEPFIVSNTPPQLFLFEKGITVNADKTAAVAGFVSGRVALKGAQYRIGDGDWTAISPEDEIWDSSSEPFRFLLTGLPSGEHQLEVKVVDAAGGVTTGKVKFTIP